MVVVLPADVDGKLIRTDGTFMELGWAVALQKPLFIVTDPGATGRSYLFDGLLAAMPHINMFGLEDAMNGDELLSRLQWELRRSEQAIPTACTLTLRCPSCGFASDSGGNP
jgi:nucleoside 2-deoxyribosyltransferase